MERAENWLGVAVGAVVALIASVWGQMHWLVQLLIVLAFADMLVGALAAALERSLSVDTALRGATKKAIAMVLVGVGMFIDQRTGGALPLVEAIAGYYAAREGLSLLRNAERAGLPTPAFLKDRFTQLAPKEAPSQPPSAA